MNTPPQHLVAVVADWFVMSLAKASRRACMVTRYARFDGFCHEALLSKIN